MPDIKISKLQQSILDFIEKEVQDKGYPPSVREIGEAVGLKSSSTVHGHLARLKKKNLIYTDPTKPRAIKILENPDKQIEMSTIESKVAQVPLIGRVTAGAPILATEDIQEYYPVPAYFVGEHRSFMLTVVGDSMIEAGILNGDYIIVRQQSTAKNGEIVVAMTEDEEATVKRFYKESNHIRLQPENSSMKPLLLKNVTILGKVVGLIRNM